MKSRSLPAVVAGILVGAAILTPVLGSAAAFLTKKKADKRYLGNTTVATTTSTFTADSGGSLTVSCPQGRQATNGGIDSPFFIASTLTQSGVVVTESKPIVTGMRATGWNVELFTGNGGPYTVTAYAVCVP